VLGVPPSSVLPQLVKAVAVSKPRRSSWLIEELLDALIPLDESVEISRTRFPGVLVVISEKLTPRDVARAALRVELSFMSRLVPAIVALEAEREEQVVEALLDILGRARVGEVRLEAVIRGEGKRVVTEAMVREALVKAGLRLAMSSKKILALESIDKLFVAAIGEARKCGLSCKLIHPEL